MRELVSNSWLQICWRYLVDDWCTNLSAWISSYRTFEAWLTSLIRWPCNKILGVPKSTQLCTNVLSWKQIYEQIIFSFIERASTYILTPYFWKSNKICNFYESKLHPNLKPEDLFNFSCYMGVLFPEDSFWALNFCPATQIRHDIFLTLSMPGGGRWNPPPKVFPP